MKIVSTDEIRQLDRTTIEKYKVPGCLLMEMAGKGVADGVIRLFQEHGLARKDILLVAGRGNNGGDAFVAARFLKESGFAVRVLLAGDKSKLRGDALFHFNKMARDKIPVTELKTENDWQKFTLLRQPARDDSGRPGKTLWFATGRILRRRSGYGGQDGVPGFAGFRKDAPSRPLRVGTAGCFTADKNFAPAVVVDGVFGTGLEGKARGVAACAIRFINALSKKSLVVAIDIPSGLNSDTGLADGDVVRADLTITMGLPKKGLIEQNALEYVGRLEVVDIGFPSVLVEKIKSDIELITPSDLSPLFPRRQRSSHKGNYGHLLIMGGAEGYSGAMTLAALAAVRTGAGLVTVVVPERLMPVVARAVPEAMVHGAPETESGSLDSTCWQKWKKQGGKLGGFSAILAGPGMTRHSATFRLIKMILRDSKIPVVLDADALNVFEGKAVLLAKRQCPLVITPHPGEMARLLGISAAQVQSNRFAVAMKASSLTHSTTVLKGAGTLVAEEGKLQINLTGNPGMAAGGMGDVLAGLMGGFLAQGMKPFDAARASVYLHGRAGDLAAAGSTEQTLIARDLIACLLEAFREICKR